MGANGGRSTTRGPSSWGGGGSGGGGGGAPTDAGYVVTAANGTLSNETLIGSIILTPDTFANRPSAAGLVAGTIFWATDTLEVFRADGAGAWVTAQTGVVMTTTNQTVAGVKTFSTADSPVVVDEAYNATNWNGDLSVPTKNAVRDQFETLPDISIQNDVTLDVTNPLIALLGRTGLNVQTFTNGGGDTTWEKPTNATIVIPICIAGGGGGASGRKGAAGGLRYGGGGGQGGMLSFAVLQAADCGATETVTVGAGGAGGAAQATNGTDGVTGTAGVATTFGSLVNAAGGNPGLQGTATSGFGGGNPWSLNSGAGYAGVSSGQASKRSSLMNYGGAYSGTIATTVAAMGGGGVGSGGAGGGIDAANVGRAGSNASGSPGAAAVTGGAVNTAGGAGNAGVGMTGGSGGAGGGGSNAGGTAGAGGAGGNYGGGGGGGGAGVDAATSSGAGGAGAAGYVIVITIF